MPRTSLFVYGTLMDEDRVAALTGRRFPRRPAELEDFERVQAATGYPIVLPKPGARVAGLLLDDVDPAALAAFDAYEDEGRLYHRRPAIAVSEERRISCQVYVGAEARGRARTRRRASPA